MKVKDRVNGIIASGYRCIVIDERTGQYHIISANDAAIWMNAELGGVVELNGELFFLIAML